METPPQVGKSQILITAAGVDLDAAVQGSRPHLFEEPRLANAGFSLDEHHLRTAGGRSLKAAL